MDEYRRRDKQYTSEARRGIKGEAFFETLIVDHAIPHRIARQNDLGVDFLCEWTHGERPCGVLFTAQVKSTTIIAKVTPKLDESCDQKNWLDRYTLRVETVHEKDHVFGGAWITRYFFFDVIEYRLLAHSIASINAIPHSSMGT